MHVFARTKGGDPRDLLLPAVPAGALLDAVGEGRSGYHRRPPAGLRPQQPTDSGVAGVHRGTDQSRQTARFRSARTSTGQPVAMEQANEALENPAGGQRALRHEVAAEESVEGVARRRPATVMTSSAQPRLQLLRVGAGGAARRSPAPQPVSTIGSFALTGCKGYPEPTQPAAASIDFLPQFKDTSCCSGALHRTGAGRDRRPGHPYHLQHRHPSTPSSTTRRAPSR